MSENPMSFPAAYVALEVRNFYVTLSPVCATCTAAILQLFVLCVRVQPRASSGVERI